MAVFRVNPALDLELAHSAEVRAMLHVKAQKVEARAKGIAPVLTGAYQASIHVQDAAEGVDVLSDIRYAGYLEFGTSDTPTFATLRTALSAAAG